MLESVLRMEEEDLHKLFYFGLWRIKFLKIKENLSILKTHEKAMAIGAFGGLCGF